jgi:hypothetical protein
MGGRGRTMSGHSEPKIVLKLPNELQASIRNLLTWINRPQLMELG